MKENKLFFQSDQLDKAETLCGTWIKDTTELKQFYTQWISVLAAFSIELVNILYR